MAVVAGIRIYPVKSCSGIDVESATVELRGLAHDRRYMLVDAADRFVTQREHPEMALIRVDREHSSLTLHAPGQPPLVLADAERCEAQARVRIWRGTTEADVAPAHINAWFARYLGFDCRLVRMSEDQHRAVPHDSARFDDEVSFADGAPVLLASLGSLAALNARLERAAGIAQFRANLIVEGAPAFAEDAWWRIRIGEAEFDVAWPCARCVMITIDPETGRAAPDGEPLRTLKTFRRVGRGVMFGQNMLPRRLGRVALGDRVEILSLRNGP